MRATSLVEFYSLLIVVFTVKAKNNLGNVLILIVFSFVDESIKRTFMSFQAYLKTIKEKTGHGPAEFRTLAEQKAFTHEGKLKPEVKAGDIVNWLKADFELGQGHAMAIYALLKGIKDENSQ